MIRKTVSSAILISVFIFTSCGGGGGGGGGQHDAGDAPENWVQDAYLKASNAGAIDVFGNAVAVDGDTIVIGAPYESGGQKNIINDDGVASDDNSASQAGAAYVFKRDASGNWSQDAYLKASNAGAGDQFGIAVAVYGDIIVVGAVCESSGQKSVTNDDGTASADDSLTGAGAVYVFKKDSTGAWVQDAYLKASNAAASNYFGCAVAAENDTIVVGAYGESSSGAAYVFSKDGSGNWMQDACLKASNAGANDQFGISVAMSGGVIVVGADKEASAQTGIINTDGIASADNSAYSSGAAYVFKKEVSGTWIQDAYLKASNAGSYDGFGFSVAISDGIIVVGANTESSSQDTVTNDDGSASEDNASLNMGAAYVFKTDGSGNWIQDAYLKPSNTIAEKGNDVNFGWSVAVSGDVIIVGAVYEYSNQTGIINDDGTASADISAVYAGAVFAFERDGSGNWIQDAYIKASNDEASDCFGTSVAISGETVVTGSFGEDSSQTAVTNDDGMAGSDNTANVAGAAYVFTRK
jgi:trimeric autotransporter adhesin